MRRRHAIEVSVAGFEQICPGLDTIAHRPEAVQYLIISAETDRIHGSEASLAADACRAGQTPVTTLNQAARSRAGLPARGRQNCGGSSGPGVVNREDGSDFPASPPPARAVP